MADTKEDSISSVNNEFEQSLMEVEALSDEELYESLKASGKQIGPVVETTRRLYQKQLAVIMSGSPNGSVRKSIVTNGNAEEQNGNASDSDDASFETSSRASHSSRGSSSVVRKNRAAAASLTTASTVTGGDNPSTGKSDEPEVQKTRVRYSAFETPTRSSRTFEEYVAESEARKATHGDTYLRRQHSVERSQQDTKEGRSGLVDLKIALLLAILVAAAAFAYIKFGSALFGAPKDRDALIDEEIEKLTKQNS